MATPIILRIVHGRLFLQVLDTLFPTFVAAASAWSAAERHRLDIVDAQGGAA